MAGPSHRIVFRRPKLDLLGRQVAGLRQFWKKAAADISQLENVASVTVGEKHRGGKPTGTLALVAHVTRKGGNISADNVIPATVSTGGQVLDTDVSELGGLPVALAARAGDTIWSGDGDYGTACLTFIKSGMGYVTTNAHVVSNIASSHMFFPNIMHPGGQPQPLTLGAIAYISSFPPGRKAREDLAVIQTTAADVQHLGMVGQAAIIARIDGFGSNLGARYWYNVNGARVQLERPQPSLPGVSTPMLIDGIWYPYQDFWVLRVAAGQVQHGHSGAVICCGEGDNISACGILFGGVLPGTAYAFQLQPIFRQAYDRIP